MRIPFIYLVRTVAAFAVVMVHTSAIYVSPPNFGKMWWLLPYMVRRGSVNQQLCKP